MVVASNKITMHLSETLTVDSRTHDRTRRDAVPAQTIANILDWSTITEFVIPATLVPKVPGIMTREAVWACSVAGCLKAGLHGDQAVDAIWTLHALLQKGVTWTNYKLGSRVRKEQGRLYITQASTPLHVLNLVGQYP